MLSKKQSLWRRRSKGGLVNRPFLSSALIPRCNLKRNLTVYIQYVHYTSSQCQPRHPNELPSPPEKIHWTSLASTIRPSRKPSQVHKRYPTTSAALPLSISTSRDTAIESKARRALYVEHTHQTIYRPHLCKHSAPSATTSKPTLTSPNSTESIAESIPWAGLQASAQNVDRDMTSSCSTCVQSFGSTGYG
jgi:hypothetical protein